MRAYERLLRYISFLTPSNSSSKEVPSTVGQLHFGTALAHEMRELGMVDVFQSDTGVVYGTIPGNIQGPTLGLIAHLDVSSAAPSGNITPHIIYNYDGGKIQLNETIFLSPSETPELAEYVGQDLIVTDGTTLLGADDKAGIAEILTMAEYFQNNPNLQHGTVRVAFTPDEEIGRGTEHFDLDLFGADFAYTVDGNRWDEISYQTFYGSKAEIQFKGISAHPGEGKNKLVNALLLAMELNSLLPPAERPEHTEGLEGFFSLMALEGSIQQARAIYILRDFQREGLERRECLLRQGAEFLSSRHKGAQITVQLTSQFANMEEAIAPHMHLVEHVNVAIRQAGGVPSVKPARGTTDGSELSAQGLPCPNIGIGGGNFHSVREYVSLQAMDHMVEVLTYLARNIAITS